MLSIKPEYVDRILKGEKTYEFRRRIFKRRDVDTIVIYATSPRSAVVAEATIGGILEETPERIWKRTRKHGGIDEDGFMSYFDGSAVAYAIKLSRVTRFPEPIPLSDYAPEVKAPPQSFIYIQ
ncbi:ASCH domain-containing protein [Bifidobacterium lemurum]|nr:ASCH domain-containing protein [Bifidobacterium lemurum]